MEKKKIIFYLIIYFVVFVWLFIVGHMNGSGSIFGDINLLDEGQYAAWIQRMLHGQVIYKDFYVQYGPLMVYPQYFFMKLFGETFFYVRLWNTLSIMFGLVVVGYILQKLQIRKMLIITSLIVLTILPGVSIRQFLGVLILGVIIFNRTERKISIISGVLLVIAFLQSIEFFLFTSIILFLFVYIRLLVVRNFKKEISYWILLIAIFFISIFMFFVLTLSKNLFANYISSSIDISKSVSGMNLPNGQGIPNILMYRPRNMSITSLGKFIFSKEILFYWSYIILLIFLSTGFVRVLVTKINNRMVFSIFLNLYALLVYLSIIGRSGHYFEIFPYIVILSTYYFNEFLGTNFYKKRDGRLFASIFLLMIILYFLRHASIFRYDIFTNIKSARVANVKKVMPISISISQANDFNALRDYFTHIRADKNVYIFNNEPGLYFIIDKINPTRFDLPLLAGSIEKRYQLLNSIKKGDPEYILIDRMAWAVDGVSDQQRMPELHNLISNNYKDVALINKHYRILKKVKRNY